MPRMDSTFTKKMPDRRSLVAMLLTLMSLLAALSGTGYGPPMWWAGIAAWLAAIMLWPQLTGAQRRLALLLAGIGLVAAVATWIRGGQLAWIGLLTQNTALLGMLAAVSFLQLLGRSEGETQELPKGKLALWRTAVGVHLLGAVINLSALFIMADRIGSNGKPRIEQVALLSRAYLAAALWSPFFAATAVALTYAPGANPLGLMAAGITLAALLICLAGYDIIRSGPDRAENFVGYPMHLDALAIPGVLAVLVGLGHWIFPRWAMLSVVSFASLIVVVFTMMCRQGPWQASRSMIEQATARLPNMSGELILFLAAGCFASGLSSLIGTGGIWMPFTKFGVVEAATVLAIMILLAAVGVHAVISITMAATWLAPLQPEPTLLALVFVQSWAIGLAAGPTSGTNITIQGRYGIPAMRMARGNIRYCLQAYGAAVIWQVIISICLRVFPYE